MQQALKRCNLPCPIKNQQALKDFNEFDADNQLAYWNFVDKYYVFNYLLIRVILKTNSPEYIQNSLSKIRRCYQNSLFIENMQPIDKSTTIGFFEKLLRQTQQHIQKQQKSSFLYLAKKYLIQPLQKITISSNLTKQNKNNDQISIKLTQDLKYQLLSHNNKFITEKQLNKKQN